MSIGRRSLLGAALAVGGVPTLARGATPVAQAIPAAPTPTFPPSDVVPILGRGAAGRLIPAAPPGVVSERALDEAQAYSDSLGGTALLVSVDGRLVRERYAPGFDAATRLKTYSMAKSVMGLAFGLAVARGVVTLDDPLSRHLSELKDDPRGAVTLRQLLQMRSGLRLDSLARRDPAAIALITGREVTRIALATPLVGTPGARFEYANVNSFLAGYALDRALLRAGLGRYPRFLSEALWRPLGQSDATLEVESAPDGQPRYFAGLDADARDWVRIGQLFTDGGRVDGRAVVPAEWIKAMTTPSPNPSYGLQMWIGQPWVPQRRYGPNTPSVIPCREPYLAPDLVFFDGAGAQRVYMVPSRKLVIARTGAPSNAWDDSILPNTILRGMA